MILSRTIIEYAVYCLAAASAILVIVRRSLRTVEGRVGVLLLIVLLLTLAAFLIVGSEYPTVPDVLLALFLIELGVFGRAYDAHRTFRSISGTLRNVSSLYIFTGLVCLLSRQTGFPVWLWVFPVLLFAAGYFFLRRRKGVANVVCKGCAVLISTGFIASMLYDIREDAAPPRAARLAGEPLPPEVMKPSIVDQLNALNEKVTMLEEELGRSRAACKEMEAKVAAETTARKEAEARLAGLEGADAAASEAVKGHLAELSELRSMLAREQAARAEVERSLEAVKSAAGPEGPKDEAAKGETLGDMLEKERAARAEAEAKLAELEKAKASAKESFTAIEEKLNLAAENLKKVMAERDAVKAELEALKSAPTPTPKAAPEVEEVKVLKSRLAQKDEELARAKTEANGLRGAIRRAREALGAEAGPPAEDASRR